MSLAKLFRKLRKKGVRNYLQFLFCVSISVTLITSFSLMLYTTVVQTTLPIGGDSRKQVMFIFMIALIGCFIFTLYAASLFLTYKSREIGVFLVLGTKKKQLTKVLFSEIASLVAACATLGLILGTGLAFVVWQLFAFSFFRQVTAESFNISLKGLLVGALFGLVVGIALLLQAGLFMKRNNLMEILQAQRRTESLPIPTKTYGLIGLFLLVSGLLLGYAVPQILAIFGKRLPSIWNIVYLLVLIGLYRMMVYIVARHKRGNNPQKYYRHLLDASMMKFQGKQTVRNMLICTLLLSAALFAMFYTALLSTSVNPMIESPVDFSLHYPESEIELTHQGVEALASKYQVELTDYQEVSLAELVVSGVWRDWDDDGNLLEEYHEKYQLADIMPLSQFNQVTRETYQLTDGKYYRVITPEAKEGFFEKYDDVTQITNPVTKEVLPVTFAGTVAYQPLVNNGNFRLVVTDENYARLSQELTAAQQNKQVLFNAKESTNILAFSRGLYREFLSQSSEEMAVLKGHDPVTRTWTVAAGQSYDYDDSLDLTETNTELMENWKYYPNLTPYVEQTFFKNFAVFFLVFMYVSIICLVAVAVISYTRCMAIGASNKWLTEDLRKLGAGKSFITPLIIRQLRKVFIVPSIIGLLLVGAFTFSMLVGNDGQLSSSEASAVLIDAVITLVVFGFQYSVYRFSLRRVKEMVGI